MNAEGGYEWDYTFNFYGNVVLILMKFFKNFYTKDFFHKKLKNENNENFWFKFLKNILCIEHFHLKFIEKIEFFYPYGSSG